MIATTGRIAGKTIRFLVALSKALIDDRERAKRIAKIGLKAILPEIGKRLISHPALRDFLSKAINWDVLIDLLINWIFDKIVEELDLDKFLREILDEAKDFALETSFRLAITFAMHAASVGVSFRQLGKNTYLMVLTGPKGGRVILSFRW